MKKLLHLLLFSAFTFAAIGQKSNSVSKPILWKIEKDNVETSYIFATGPVCESNVNFSDEIKSLIDKVKFVAIEYELYNQKDIKKLSSMNVAEDPSFATKNALSAVDYAKLKSLFSGKGVPENALDRFGEYRISMVYFLLNSLTSACGPMKLSDTYEKPLQQYAQKAGKEYVVLQSTDEFVAEFKSRSAQQWAAATSWLLTQNNDILENLQQNEFNFYSQAKYSELKTLYKNNLFLNKFGNEYVEGHVSLLSGRIDELTKKGSSFIAVDLSNLLFDNSSLLTDLSAKGFKITKL